MATKPSSQPAVWASNALYTTGPFIGSSSKVVPPAGIAAEGHRPGAAFPTPAEYENDQQNKITALCQWVFAGSSTGAADAHIVEVDADGEGQVERWRVVPANAHSYALYVQAPPGAGFAIQASGASALGDPTVYTETTGPGAALEAFSAAAGTAIVVNHSGTSDGVVVNQPGGAGDCVTINCAGTGAALIVNGGPSMPAAAITGGAAQAAVSAVSGTNAAAAVGALGVGTALGLDASGGSGSPAATGARGSAVHADAAGLYGRSAAAASNTGTGVTAEGRGSGAGLRAIAAAFHAAIFQGDTTAPMWAALRLIGANARPTQATAGSIDYSTTEDQLVIGNGLDNAYRAAWTTTGGKATAYTASEFGAQNVAQTSGQVNWVVAASCSATDGNAPKVAGRDAVLRFRCTARTMTPGSATWVGVRLLANGVTINGSTRVGNTLGFDGAGFYVEASGHWSTPIVFDFEFQPSVGDATYSVEIRGITMVETRVRDCSLTLDGLF